MADGHRIPTSLAFELVRYGINGLVLNGTLFSLYVGLVAAGVAPLLVAAVLYPTGVVLSYMVHRRMTFRSKARVVISGFRFLVTYGTGYLLNLALLWIQINRLDVGPILAQAVAIVVVAAFLFLAQKLWVFEEPAGPTRPATGP